MAGRTSTGHHELIVTLPSETEIGFERRFDAPREVVFAAFTEPEHLVHWWGPSRYSLPVCEADLRPGGAYRMVVRGDDGHEVTFHGEIREIVRPGRVVQTIRVDVEPIADMEAVQSVDFEEVDGGTLLTATMRFPSREARDGFMAGDGMEQGAIETYERLDDYLATLAA